MKWEKWTGVLMVVFAVVFSPALFAEGPVVYVLKHKSLSVYNETEAAVVADLKLDYTVVTANVTLDTINSVSRAIRKKKAVAVVAIGTKATAMIKKKVTRIPILVCMALRPVKTCLVPSLKRPGHMITGISLDIPVEVQFKRIRKLFPWINRIGVLYTPNQDEALIAAAKKSAKRYGFKLYIKPIHSQSQIQPQLKDLFQKQIELLWAIPDQKIYSKQNLEYILLSLNRFKIPFMGLSRAYLSMGAFFSFDPDPSDIGKRTAALVKRVDQKGVSPGKISIKGPKKINYSINQRVMKRFGFHPPQETLRNAKEVFQ